MRSTGWRRTAWSRAGSNPDDGRGTLAALTAAGRRRAAAATDAMNEQVFTDIGVAPPTVPGLFDLLAELRRAAGDFEEPGWKVV